MNHFAYIFEQEPYFILLTPIYCQMSSILTLNVICDSVIDNLVVDYFESEEWNAEAEHRFINKIQELFSLLRGHSDSINLDFKVMSRDISYLAFILQKKKSNKVEINHTKLSLREIEILGMIMQGLTNNQIAEKLFIAFETVKSHRRHILEKTGAKNTAALINYYHQTFFEK